MVRLLFAWIVSKACQLGMHHKCPRKLGSGKVCECDCHPAK